MDFKQMIITSLMGFIAQFLMMPTKAAKYAKYLLKVRDWLNLLFPVTVYPTGGAFDNNNPLGEFSGMSKDKVSVPLSAVKEATKTQGFNIPFIRGA